MTSKPSILSRKPYPLQLTKEYLRALGREHAVDVLEALAKAKNGLRFQYINFEVIKTSGTSGVLKSLQKVGLVSKDDGSYHITHDGLKALELCKPILDLGSK
jgi:predicted transcriptional regulator